MTDGIKTLSIKTEESLASIEELLSFTGSNDQFKLRLPAKLNSKGALGVETSVIQFIATWLRHKTYTKILHTHQNASVSEFEDLCSSVYGIAALSLSDEIWDLKKIKVQRSMALLAAKKNIESLRSRKFKESFKSRYVGIPCIKTPKYDKEFLMPLYSSGEVIGSKAFYSIINKVFENVINGTKKTERLNNYIGIGDLSEVLWELFKNTHDHGRKTLEGMELDKNFRSLIIQQQDITDNYLENWLSDTPSVSQQSFANSIQSVNGKYHILDVSIIDFGAGFIELARDKSGQTTAKNILLNCFKSGWSRLNGNTRGDGLTKVLEKIVANKGWLRIRTGNLLLEKSFDDGSSRNIQLEDIKETISTVVGTTVHISIPLREIGKR